MFLIYCLISRCYWLAALPQHHRSSFFRLNCVTTVSLLLQLIGHLSPAWDNLDGRVGTELAGHLRHTRLAAIPYRLSTSWTETCAFIFLGISKLKDKARSPSAHWPNAQQEFQRSENLTHIPACGTAFRKAWQEADSSDDICGPQLHCTCVQRVASNTRHSECRIMHFYLRCTSGPQISIIDSNLKSCHCLRCLEL